MSWCYKNSIEVVPQGGNTSLMGGSVPEKDARAVVLNLRRMAKVLDVDIVNDTMTVQAGVTLSAARATAEDANRLFPLRIGSEGSCQIGGNLATNAGGTAVLRYGNMRDLVLGIEVVLPDGRIYSSLKGLRKDNTGYDLKNLFIGSEGTLGIITAAVLKLMPKPQAVAAAFIAVQDPKTAVEFLSLAKQIAGPMVTAFELVSGDAMELVCSYLGGITPPLSNTPSWMVLMELTSTGSQDQIDQVMMQLLEIGMEKGLVLDAAIAANLSQVQSFWKIREEISDSQTKTGGSIKCDVSVSLSRIPEFIEKGFALVKSIAPESRMVVYGHMGDGNVHFNPLRPVDQDAKTYLNAYYKLVSHGIDDLIVELGGSISAEHGIGVAKRDDLNQSKSAVEIELMWQIKNTLDPKNLLNPKKLLPTMK
jgi:FAD/FMN-containing dehydrogenase